jgi:hypothetical protein
MSQQFLCLEHHYDWSIDEDGINTGCVWCVMQDIEADNVDAAYEYGREHGLI